MKDVKPAVAAILIVMGAIVGFGGGMWYQKSKNPMRSGFQMSAGNRFGATGEGIQRRAMSGFNGGGMVVGEVADKDGESLTIRTIDGSSKIILINSSTQYRKSADATSDDIKKGDTVAISGTNNQDGSITASNVQLNPGYGVKVTGVPTEK